jgi:hypothetical protein
MEINIGDKVIYNSKLYKVLQVRDNKYLKLQSVRSKINEILFNVPLNLVTIEIKTRGDKYATQLQRNDLFSK